MATDWKKFLEPFFGQRCTLEDVGYAGEDFEPDVFDSDKQEQFVASFIEDVIGGWGYADEQFGTEPGKLVMFASNSLDGDSAAALFYHRDTGRVYKYEEADFSDTELNLDRLGLKAIGKTPDDALIRE